MKLYLVQHGEAAAESENPKRPLTEQGKMDVKKVAHFLDQDGVEVDRIWHSAKTRAIQTAEIFAEALHIKELCQEQEGLNPNDSVDPVLKKIIGIKPEDEIENLMIVGHLPFLQKLASSLLSGEPPQELIQFHQGGVVCLEKLDEGPWQFVWAVIPDLLKS